MPSMIGDDGSSRIAPTPTGSPFCGVIDVYTVSVCVEVVPSGTMSAPIAERSVGTAGVPSSAG